MSLPIDAKEIEVEIRAPESKPDLNRGVIFCLVSLTLLMMSADSTIVATILHTLQDDLDTSLSWAGWTITAYSFGFVIMLPISGRLSEHFGRRRVFLYSVAIFSVASLLCGLTDNIYVLIALRALQAVGGAGFTPSATGIIVDYFGDARDRAVSLLGSIFPIGAMIGPILGGMFVSYWTWKAAFLVNVPVGIAILILGLRYIPRDTLDRERVRFTIDFLGMLLLSAALFAGMLAAIFLGENTSGVSTPGFSVSLAVAVLAALMFFRHINRSRHPFIEPRLIYGANFGAVNFINMIFTGVTIGAVALIPLYAANRYGLGALDAGMLLVAEGIAALILSIASAMVLRHTGHRLPIYIGAVMIAIGTLGLGLSPMLGLSPYAWLASSALLIGIGTGAINPASRNAGLQLAPSQSSTLAAIRTLSLQMGSIAMVSITTTVLVQGADPGEMHAWVYLMAALLLIVCVPVVSRIPEHRGSW